MDQNPDYKDYDLVFRCKLIVALLLRKCKIIRLVTTLLDIVVITAGFTSIYHPSKWVTSIIVITIVGSTWLRWSREKIRSNAERFKRIIERGASRGCYPRQELLKIKAEFGILSYSGKLQEEAKGLDYYAEGKIDSSTDGLILLESSWWSMKVARLCAYWQMTMTLLLVSCYVIFVSTYLGDPNYRGFPREMAFYVTNAVVFVLCISSAKVTSAYFSFSASSKKIHNALVLFIIKSEKSNETERTDDDLLVEYQLSRAASPLLYTWIWRLRRKKFNAIYQCYSDKIQNE